MCIRDRFDTHFTEFQMNNRVHQDGSSSTTITSRLSVITVFYDRKCLEAVIRFFALSGEAAQIQAIATENISKIASKLDLLDAARNLASHQMIFDVDVQAPVLILPEDTRCSPGSKLLIASLGHFSCKSATTVQREFLHDADGENDRLGEVCEADAYDAYKLALSRTSLLMVPDASKWSYLDGSARGAIELLPASNTSGIDVTLRRCVVASSVQYPAVCLDVVVHPIRLQLKPEYVDTILRVVLALPPQRTAESQELRSTLAKSGIGAHMLPKVSVGNVRLLSANVVFERLSLEVVAHDTPLVEVNIANVVLDSVVNEYDSRFSFRIGDLVVADLFTKSTADEFRYLAVSSADQQDSAPGESDPTDAALVALTVQTASPKSETCLLYTSDAADEEDSVDFGGRRTVNKKKMRTIKGIG
eukprot:TRINITY_DN22044_c0_g2_i2.p1 TRINITY_DN22044_c0_g2~~TRINITY_DN22044_c0_g2_i2.p1  ORF type:complete len:418 (+),score=78.69 TRINITY_DN22044_c0_g2_i2:116-1369(+)